MSGLLAGIEQGGDSVQSLKCEKASSRKSGCCLTDVVGEGGGGDKLL